MCNTCLSFSSIFRPKTRFRCYKADGSSVSALIDWEKPVRCDTLRHRKSIGGTTISCRFKMKTRWCETRSSVAHFPPAQSSAHVLSSVGHRMFLTSSQLASEAELPGYFCINVTQYSVCIASLSTRGDLRCKSHFQWHRADGSSLLSTISPWTRSFHMHNAPFTCSDFPNHEGFVSHVNASASSTGEPGCFDSGCTRDCCMTFAHVCGSLAAHL